MKLYLQDPIPDAISNALLKLCMTPGVKCTLTNDMVRRFWQEALVRVDRVGIHVDVVALNADGQRAIDAFASAHAA